MKGKHYPHHLQKSHTNNKFQCYQEQGCNKQTEELYHITYFIIWKLNIRSVVLSSSEGVQSLSRPLVTLTFGTNLFIQG